MWDSRIVHNSGIPSEQAFFPNFQDLRLREKASWKNDMALEG